MINAQWRDRAGTSFQCEKQPATGRRGMVVTNHPLASAAGAEMLAAGGNAIDAAIAALFALTVVEPMMVGILGGGMAHIRLADGTHTVIDGHEHGAAARRDPTCTRPIPTAAPGTMDTVGRRNAVGPTGGRHAGNLMGWCEALRRFGTMLAGRRDAAGDPPCRRAASASRPTCTNASPTAPRTWRRIPSIARLYLPGGTPLKAGDRLVQGDYAETPAR